MKIYTGIVGGDKLKKATELGLGIMISSTPTRKPNKDIKHLSCALDNGAWACYAKGYPFMEKVFLDAIDASYKAGIKLDFIVTPDIVCGGKKSLDFSMQWTKRLAGCKNLALVVQDGMEPKDLNNHVMSHFTHIFVGGSVGWKWKTAQQWRDHSWSYGKKCHIGGCGRYEKLEKASMMCVDSVDSTSFAVNGSWEIIERFKDMGTLFSGKHRKE
jgi:hypothetical protein